MSLNFWFLPIMKDWLLANLIKSSYVFSGQRLYDSLGVCEGVSDCSSGDDLQPTTGSVCNLLFPQSTWRHFAGREARDADVHSQLFPINSIKHRWTSFLFMKILHFLFKRLSLIPSWKVKTTKMDLVFVRHSLISDFSFLLSAKHYKKWSLHILFIDIRFCLNTFEALEKNLYERKAPKTIYDSSVNWLHWEILLKFQCL